MNWALFVSKYWALVVLFYFMTLLNLNHNIHRTQMDSGFWTWTRVQSRKQFRSRFLVLVSNQVKPNRPTNSNPKYNSNSRQQRMKGTKLKVEKHYVQYCIIAIGRCVICNVEEEEKNKKSKSKENDQDYWSTGVYSLELDIRVMTAKSKELALFVDPHETVF